MPSPDERDADLIATALGNEAPWALPLTRSVGEILAEALYVTRAHPEHDIPGLLLALAVTSDQAGVSAGPHELIPPAFWPASAEILRSLATYTRAVIDAEGRR